MNPQQWLENELQRELYGGWSAEEIHAYLNAPQVTETDNPEEQGTITVVPSAEELVDAIGTEKYARLLIEMATWSDLTLPILQDEDKPEPVKMAILGVNIRLRRKFGSEKSASLADAVDVVLASSNAALAQGVMQILAMVPEDDPILSADDLQALGALMVRPDPEWRSTVYTKNPSRWTENTGLAYLTLDTVREVMDDNI